MKDYYLTQLSKCFENIAQNLWQ